MNTLLSKEKKDIWLHKINTENNEIKLIVRLKLI